MVTRAQSRNYGLDFSDTFLVTEQNPDAVMARSKNQAEVKPTDAVSSPSSPGVVKLPATRENFIAAQQGDKTLSKCHSSVLCQEEAKMKKIAYVLDDGLLMCRDVSEDVNVPQDVNWSATYQVVVPMAYRLQVLSLAHDHLWSGHMGVTKTYNRVLKHFFWPGLKSDVVHHCRTCHVSSYWKTKSGYSPCTSLPHSSNGRAI